MQQQGTSASSERGSEAIDERTTLFTTLAERLLAGEATEDPARRAHLIRLLSSLMPESRERARRAIAERLADMPSPPKDLALAIARDRAELVQPILRNVPFSQTELIELVTRTGPEHHIEIAKRNDLTLDVWLALARAAARRARESADSAPTSESTGSAKAEPAGKPVSPDVEGTGTMPFSGSPGAAPEPPPEPPAELPHTAAAPRTPSLGAAPLEDPGPTAWRFETDRAGRLVRLSPNARQAFGEATPSLIGESFAHVMQMHAAVPAHEDIAEAMARRTPIGDLVVELVGRDDPARRWCLRARPRFSFPDGRFEGYVGTARDLDAEDRPTAAPEHPAQLLDRLEQAADRLAASATTTELKEYAEAMKDCIEALKAMPLTGNNDLSARRPASED